MKRVYCEQKNLELMTVIVDFGMGSQVLKLAKKMGVSGGTICLGKGTIKNALLEKLGINDIRKEIILMVANKYIANNCMPEIEKKLKLKKNKTGIGFSSSVDYYFGSKDKENFEENKEVETMYNCIYVIVDKGKGSDVVDAANKAGSRGCTIINARGSGIHETSTLFAMAIEPEKEIVMILAEKDITEPILRQIKEELKIDEAGNGIIFVQKVNQAYGMKRSDTNKA